MKTFFLFLTFFSFGAFAAPEVMVECNGRSWLHTITIDTSVSPPVFVYSRGGFFGGAFMEFPVQMTNYDPTNFKIDFASPENGFGGGVTYTDAYKTVKGKKMALGKGSMFKKGASIDPIFNGCYIDRSILGL